MSIAENLADIKARLPKNGELVAVSKFHPADAIQQAYGAAQGNFG